MLELEPLFRYRNFCLFQSHRTPCPFFKRMLFQYLFAEPPPFRNNPPNSVAPLHPCPPGLEQLPFDGKSCPQAYRESQKGPRLDFRVDRGKGIREYLKRRLHGSIGSRRGFEKERAAVGDEESAAPVSRTGPTIGHRFALRLHMALKLDLQFSGVSSEPGEVPIQVSLQVWGSANPPPTHLKTKDVGRGDADVAFVPIP